ncbi:MULTISPECIES: 16S rRNA (cytidine(1402)-2'-O)-methyltransferase [unclassified Ruegeria]|uniref:16S rRNA (cytidine(1402)-2'-O)-methyltransferase n=1 Tax=unclassified Ruegeria TaxID=2625375 RepID=UPI001488C342|nr:MULTISPECIES: 16S rRNA (cytidine(1402)-2'-O)-methyltransferase [unclassified Ruegeria]NOD35010.1 16S rRNA (cytidine(1402)-2'-O)-methyltransferase [Ruegeria sp. HKCCD7296]NOD47910.1 16S rRNA (cytidine(1402)-2'-O)-methyltransferase [Ruegeria sp. HKCCD5849]NOD52894.1 16S rRNA (cytidine(1402)-2'-O)-methyltransferase [Ruegeria sp. HKCCD5851]NOD69040.1 16S rRNA (cytidine(1402)-2'-O)-methyltransferase [Ruegeria sp. HKCCD7303]NOE35263.1 16S rRNA (cytidine(1402)-2'-O)-methyltransferase [Ruegeria sp.
MNFQKIRLTAGLYFVATPIGTARDITLRALDVLASADVIAAEDTRSLRRLMEIHGIPLEGRRIQAYHDHSGAGARGKIMEALAQGQSVAYASEAGMPLIADPGYDLGKQAAEAGHTVTCAPGASAALTALTLAGLPTDAFFFTGFLPNAAGARRARIEALKDIPGTLVIYESPKRVSASLSDLALVLGADRQAALCRELTKKFEEIRRATLADLAEEYQGKSVKGEIVVLVDRSHSQSVNESDVEEALKRALESHSVRDAADLVSKMYDLPRRPIYQKALKLGK